MHILGMRLLLLTILLSSSLHGIVYAEEGSSAGEQSTVLLEEEKESGQFSDDDRTASESSQAEKTREEQERRLLDEAFSRRSTTTPINRHSNVLADGGYLLQPGSFIEVADPGDSFVRQITILNKEGEDAIYEIHVRDLGADPETGGPRFYQPWETGPFPAKEWLQPAVNEIALHQGEIATIPVTITIPETADAGDHIASIMVKKKRMTRKPGGVIVNSYTAVLFIVTVRGDVRTGGSFENFAPQRFLNWSLPVSVVATTRNTGTVHFAPKGTITFRNIFGVTVDEINPLPWYVFRGTTDRKIIEWKPKFAIGYYTVTSDFSFDVKAGDPIPVEQRKASFLVIPLLPTLAVLLAIFFVSFLVQFFFSRFKLKIEKK